MMESGGGIKMEVPKSNEIPSHIKTVTLPDISVGDKKIRLGMHTDSIMTLLRTLNNIPEVDKLKIEGRVLTDKQQSQLFADPVYEFYLSGRRIRSNDQKGDIFVLPKEVKLDEKKVASLLQTPFTPSVLSEKIGFKVGYFSAKQMVDEYYSEYSPNDFLPMIGGLNEFKIGSDVLSDIRLSQIVEQIQLAFKKQEGSITTPTYSNSMLGSVNAYDLKRMLDHLQTMSNNIPKLTSPPAFDTLRPTSPPVSDSSPSRMRKSQLEVSLPGQVKNLSDIVVGETYREMHGDKPGTKIKILAPPYKDKDGSWWVSVEDIYPDGFKYTHNISLADKNVVPYSPGVWNPSNALIREDK